MAISPMFPLWTDAYLGDTHHLSTLEHGAYLLLLITAWRSKEGLLPDDDKMLSRFAKLSMEKWKKIRPVLEPFFCIQNGVWAQGRLLDERKADFDFRKSQSKKAKARHLKNKETTHATASSGHMPPPTPTPTLKEKKEDIKKIIKKVLQKPPDVSEQIWNDFLDHRKKKKASVSETVILRFRQEAKKINWTLEQAIIEICAQGWQGFKAEWVKNSTNQTKGNQNGKYTSDDALRDAIADIDQREKEANFLLCSPMLCGPE